MNESAFVFYLVWRVKFLSFFISRLVNRNSKRMFSPLNDEHGSMHGRMKYNSRVFGKFVNDSELLLLLQFLRFSRVGERNYRETIFLKKMKTKRRTFSPWQKFVWNPVHFTRLSHHHKEVALNGENIWRLPEPGCHIGAAHMKIFSFECSTAAALRYHENFLATQGCCDAKGFSPLSRQLRMSWRKISALVFYWRNFSNDNAKGRGMNILEMKSTSKGAARHARLFDLRVIYIYCEPCGIWIKNHYWLNRRSERRWTDPFKDFRWISGRTEKHRRQRYWSSSLKISSDLSLLLNFPPCVEKALFVATQNSP